MTKIDLHMHSSASDGTDSIPELLNKVREAGITVFSVTDHDTIAGAMEMEKIVPEDMTFIRGVEFSCITKAGKCHILGYGYDSKAKEFEEILREGFERRRNKLEKRISFMEKEFGIRFSGEELESLRGMNSVGKPHLGNMLVSKGIVENKNEAIEKYINPCKTASDRLDADKVIKAILAAGGVPVWAHPYGGTGEKEVSQEKFESQLRILMGSGIRGLECYYSKYDEKQVLSLVNQAEMNHLLISGGSDYHGKNKTVLLGMLNHFGKEITVKLLTVIDDIN